MGDLGADLVVRDGQPTSTYSHPVPRPVKAVRQRGSALRRDVVVAQDMRSHERRTSVRAHKAGPGGGRLRPVRRNSGHIGLAGHVISKGRPDRAGGRAVHTSGALHRNTRLGSPWWNR